LGWFAWLRGAKERQALEAPPAVEAPRAQGQFFAGLNDPQLLDYIRSGGSAQRALQVSAVFRCVSLISGAIGMLPLRLMKKPKGKSHVGSGAYEEATDHPLYDLLMYEPNSYQTASEFKRLMESRVLTKGNAFARIVRSRNRISALLPIDPSGATVKVAADGAISYAFTLNNAYFELPQSEIFHLRGFSTDGIIGLSMIALAEDAIGLSREAAQSLLRIYKTGVSAGGALTHPQRLSQEARDRLKANIDDYSGSINAGKWIVLDEGLKAEKLEHSARDSQMIETAKHQIEDIARFFGVPRPLMGMEDTSWGSGVEQLAILFVRFALAPSFVNWEQAVQRALLSREEKRSYVADFDERELLRGSMKDQAEFFAKASGSGGHKPWMEANEIRELTGLPPHKDGAGLMPAGAVGAATDQLRLS